MKLSVAALIVFALLLGAETASAQTTAKKPNILVLFGDDIGYWNISAYNHGMMGYRTPSIDSIAKEGAIFTDVYAQQSCTAGRAAFITGQSPIRTGLLKVGLPGAPEGLHAADPTIANLLKAQGYATGQFGKNHLGDRNEFIPTVHGFDEFFGNFYHLNAEEEPENPDYPKDPRFKEMFGPRGVFHCYATDAVSTLPDDGRFGKWGKQRCEDTGPLTKKRMETIDDEVLAQTVRFMDEKQKSGKPWFIWFNTTRMHIHTHLKPESEGKTGLGSVPDGMVEHDGDIGQVLKKLHDLGADDNTIVIYTTDNGGEVMSSPDGAAVPFRGEKNTPWEGGYRVPLVVRYLLETCETYQQLYERQLLALLGRVNRIVFAVSDPPCPALMFHTDDQDNPWVEVDLGSVKTIRRIEVNNRTDCCSDRAIPAVVEVSVDRTKWTQVGRREDEFRSWAIKFQPRSARYVKVSVPRRTTFHLKSVAVR